MASLREGMRSAFPYSSIWAITFSVNRICIGRPRSSVDLYALFTSVPIKICSKIYILLHTTMFLSRNFCYKFLHMAIEYVQNNIRLPVSLKEQVQTAAKDSKRTLAAEIELRLEQSFEYDLDEARKQAELLRAFTQDELGFVRESITRLCRSLGVED